MAHKKLLPVITILVALVAAGAIHFWGTSANAGQARANLLQQDAPRLAFTQSSTTVVEPDAGETVSVTLTVGISTAPQPGEEAMVTALTANGNAIAGVDYLPVWESLTFPSGSTSPQTFVVTILGNNFHQPNRVLVAFLTNPVNATVINPAAVTITILDNDPPGWSYMPIIRGHVAGPTPTPTRTPSYP